MNDGSGGERKISNLRRASYVIIAVVAVFIIVEVLLRVTDAGKLVRPSHLETRLKLSDFVSFLESDIHIVEKSEGNLYIEDPGLLWRLQPEFKGMARNLFVMNIADKAPRWRLTTNKRGFRGPDFEEERHPGSYRILCLGDSCTFGFGVDDEDTFPRMLESSLESYCPACRYEVINLGVPGYTSRLGLELAKKWIPRLQPDSVLISFGTNDSWRRKLNDDEALWHYKRIPARINFFLQRFAIVKTLVRLTSKKKKGASGFKDFPLRVSREQYGENIAAMAKLATENGSQVVLMNMQFYTPYGTRELINVSRKQPDYLFVDAVEILTRSLRNLDKLKQVFPTDAAFSEKIYGDELKRRPIFYVMVDPVHPNALGHRLIANNCAAAMMNHSMNKKVFNLISDTIVEFPAGATKAKGRRLSKTELEKRLGAVPPGNVP